MNDAGYREPTGSPRGTLSGIRVVEFCQIAAGPFCAMLLADQGADVIKVEPPGGDGMRQWPPLTQGFSENFASLNRNKRSIVLDLKNEANQATARALCLAADVVIENFRPGVMARLRLAYADLVQAAPKLVYCSISAYGQEGPRAQEGGFDVTLQAVGGVMSVTGEPDGAPIKCGVPLTDFTAGLYAAFAIAGALHAVRGGGGGRYIDVPMLGTTLGIAALQTSQYFGTARDPEKLGSAHPRNAPYQAFRCKDGYVVMAAGTDELFRKACASVDLAAIVDDPRFASTGLRAANQLALKALFERAFADLTPDACLAALRAAGVPCAPINTYSQALADPQVAHYGWVQPLELPNGAVTRTVTDPLGKAAAVMRRPPGLGEHTDQVLEELHDAQPRTLSGVRRVDDAPGVAKQR
jgi:crotonobetainyl-CoA:carnitine CoA-transferase CaiB-like acyl-CoA transferase